MEEAVRFEVSGTAHFGILHLPSGRAEYADFLIMVVGGPQNRTGSHRSFTQVARDLAARNIPVFRFDYAGLGDSEGDWRGFAHAGPSIKGAIDFLHATFPSLERVSLWSLCDGSAACALYASGDRRVSGMILANPYVHSAEGQAKAFLKQYYLRRLLDKAFWKKVFSFRFNPFGSLSSMRSVAIAASGGTVAAPIAGMTVGPGEDPPRLPEKVMEGLEAYRGRLRLILSTADLTAREFEDLFRSRAGKGSRGAEELRYVEGADHTFTGGEAKRRVCELSAEAWGAIRAGREA
ncbi:MAG TPA: hydrolase 1, exosortase A system-associated [Fibrobacteria bacterium]|nr:hydrolase 1, exosortase A system-associated [Fibrobacteria bacterium]